MSAFRRLTSSLRSERRCEQACPYSRPQPSPPKPKPTRRPRYWDFFNFFSFAAPYTDEEEEEAKKQAEAKAKASQQNETIVVSEQDSEMSDASASASSTEESTTTTSDSSLETVETAETSEHVEMREPTKSSEPIQPSRTVEPVEPVKSLEPIQPPRTAEPIERAESTRHEDPSVPATSAEPMDYVLTQPPVSFIPTPPAQSSDAPVVHLTGAPSSATEPPMFSSEDDILAWAKRKADAREQLNNMDFLGVKMFLENRRKDRPFEPIKLRFPRFTPAAVTSSSSSSSTDVPKASEFPSSTTAPIQLSTSSQLSTSAGSKPLPTSANGYHNPTGATPAYFSGFHSSTSLPPFKNNVPPCRPRRMLRKDPNGSITWRGAGKVRDTPEENRKRKAPQVIVSRFDPYKRNRLFEEAKGPVPAHAASSQNSSSSVRGSVQPVVSKVAPASVNRQHTVPHSPSPLRNVINGSPPSSPPKQSRSIPTNLNATSSRSAPSNQTASAAFLQEAVEKVVPRRPRYSDVVNPYQTAAPVKPVIKPMVRKRVSESRARMKDAEKQKEATKTKDAEKRELSAKEIIEATIPKGAKRSRPPPGLTKCRNGNSTSSGVASKRMLEEAEIESAPTKKRRTVTVEEVSEEDDVRCRSFPVRPNVIIESRSPSPEPSPAPSRPPGGTSRPKESSKASSSKLPVQLTSAAQAIVKEVPIKASPAKESSVRFKEQTNKTLQAPRVPSSKESSGKASTKSSSAKGPSNHFSPLLNSKVAGKSSVPREPSKLRTSFLPDECENEEPKMASPTPSATVTMTTPGTPLADIQEKKDPKEVALTLPLNDLPSFIFKTPPALIAGDHTDARVAAKELPLTSLPKFDFSKARTVMNGVIFPAVPIPTIKPFDFESAGVKAKAPSGNGQWQCPTCMLQNSSSAVEKCSICEAPRPGVEKLKDTALDDINGAKKPSSINGMIPSSRSNLPFTTSPNGKTFDFAAAGLTPKTPDAIGQWTCLTCMLQNPLTAVEKCSVCETPRPGVEKAEKVDSSKKPYMNGTMHTSNNLTNGISLPTPKSFDFAAAGLPRKTPSAGGSWHCPTCMLQNPATALEKCTVCDSPRPGMEKKAVPSSIVPVKSIPQLVPKSFDWTAVGMIPKFNGSFWTCGTCMLSNPPTETEKCKVCDASRS